jgi:beta-glucosidase
MNDNRTWGERALERMSMSEKIGQMTQASNDSITPAEVADYAIGSVLSGGNGNPSPNTPEVWADMVGSFAEAARGSRTGIPLLYGVDAVHGHSNVRGATVYPHNIGLGATGDADLVRRIGEATAIEMLATGVRWAFSPCVAVPQDIRWGRTYEGFGRDPRLVASLGAALVEGLQHDQDGAAAVLACPKHYVGDGGTSWDSVGNPPWTHWWDPWGDEWKIDQGDTRVSEDELRAVHLAPYDAAVAAGAWSVMASYSSWNGAKLHGHRRLLTGVLKDELGFPGFVVSDWMGIDQLDPDYRRSVVAAVNAGVDMVMVPLDWKQFIAVMEAAVADGDIPVARIDEAVRRILSAKAALGLDRDDPGEVPPLDIVGAREHRQLAARAARRSAVVLENRGGLPLRPGTQTIEISGRAADDIGLQCGGWTVGWQGGTGATTLGITLVDAFRRTYDGDVAYDPTGRFEGEPAGGIGIVCVAEPPYAEGPGDRAVPSVSDEDRAVFARMRARCTILILVIYSGRPVIVQDLIDRSDAAVAAWLPGTEATELPSLLLGGSRFEGVLPQPWPAAGADLDDRDAAPRYPIGHGLRPSVQVEVAALDPEPVIVKKEEHRMSEESR